MSKRGGKIPVIMYHSIGITDKNWHWNYLTCPLNIFEDQLKWLRISGYSTLNYQEIFDYIMKDIPVPKKSVFLTFDDGYLDNYVFAYPLLKKYGMKGTIFVNPDFVDKSDHLRLTSDDLEAGKKKSELENLGFCNWKELKKMDEEGIMDVQSHAKTHTWYPISDKIVDFRNPEDDYVWMDWNECPTDKPNLQIIKKDKVKLGQAIFENEKSLSAKRVFINPKFQSELENFVASNGGVTFFDKQNWRLDIENFASKLKEKEIIIINEESKEDYHERIKFELEYTKNEIENKLQKEVKFLCWPGGSATKIGVKIAHELGYLMSTAARDIPILRKKIKNTPDHKINRISRFSPVMYDNRYRNKKNSKIQYSPGWFFILQLMQFKNTYLAGTWAKGMRYIIIKFKNYV